MPTKAAIVPQLSPVNPFYRYSLSIQDCPRVVIEEDDFDDLELYTSSKGRLSPSIVQPKDDALSSSALRPVTTDERTAIEKSVSPSGWLDLLRTSEVPVTNTPTEQQRVDYFALCMASHFATVATFVPTDVDRLVLYVYLLFRSL